MNEPLGTSAKEGCITVSSCQEGSLDFVLHLKDGHGSAPLSEFTCSALSVPYPRSYASCVFPKCLQNHKAGYSISSCTGRTKILTSRLPFSSLSLYVLNMTYSSQRGPDNQVSFPNAQFRIHIERGDTTQQTNLTNSSCATNTLRQSSLPDCGWS